MPVHPMAHILKRRSLRVLGVNTGTSIDGLDLALVEVNVTRQRRNIRLLRTKSFALPRGFRKTLYDLAGATMVDKESVTRAHYRLGEIIARSVNRFRDDHAMRIDLVASHGQTIGHFPAAQKRTTGLGSATWQIGSLAVIARQTGILTVGDFRAGDIAAGGMGAPLSGYYHCLLFGTGHVVLNIGGIANISAARGRGRGLEVLAFDIGPGNMVIDAVAARALNKRYDRDGKTAASGTPDRRVLARALRHPYFRRRPPKTCGREEFGAVTVKAWMGRKPMRAANAPDLLATAVAITADAITNAVRRWVDPFTSSRSMILTGGGTQNRTLIATLRESLTDWTLANAEDFGVPARYVEPVGFAILAHETIHARPGNLGGATGGRPAILGSIALP